MNLRRGIYQTEYGNAAFVAGPKAKVAWDIDAKEFIPLSMVLPEMIREVTPSNTPKVPVKYPEVRKIRKSLLQPYKVPGCKDPGSLQRCIGCDHPVKPSINAVYGSLLVGFGSKEIEFSSFKGGKIELLSKRISFPSYRKGLLCTSCSSEYRSVLDWKGDSHLIVKIDPAPGSIGMIIEE